MTNKIELIYPELSYKIVGILYDVFNDIGPGHKESYYQKALAIAFRRANINFKEQVYFPISFGDEKIGRYFLDFMVEDKIILEIKKLDKFFRKDIDQTYAYLKATNLKLGILANFTKKGVQFKRIIHIRNS